MKKLFSICLFFSILAIHAQERIITPTIPEAFSIDLNDDSIADFSINYSSFATTDIPATHESYQANLNPLNENRILFSESDSLLEVIPPDTLRLTKEENGYWTKQEVRLLSIGAKKGVWLNEWIQHTDNANFYVVVTLVKNGITDIAWFQLALNKKDGSIQLLDKGIAEDIEKIVID